MKVIFTIAFLVLDVSSQAQQISSLSYEEFKDPNEVPVSAWNSMPDEIAVSFVSPNYRFAKSSLPVITGKTLTWKSTVWKGEKVHTQILIWTKRPLKDLNVEIKDRSDKKRSIKSHVRTRFVRYVLTDGLSESGGGCGIQQSHDSSLVADVLDHVPLLDVNQITTQPIWVSVDVPITFPTGIYNAILLIKEANKILKSLNITIEVIDKALPPPSEWKYHLDLWQNPFAISREHKVATWSNEHMRSMKPYMERLAGAGQKAITASIIYDPWNGQTQDIYHSMVRWVKRKDGTWYYDYSDFDQWVSFMKGLGVDKVINCYSMIPWNLKFYYYDEQSGKDTFIQASPGTKEYDEHWRPMLTDFSRHLKEKKWFDRTAIAMDERPLEDMKQAIELIRSVDPEFKISLAGNFHPGLSELLFDYSVASNQIVDAGKMADRKREGNITTYYTCCTEGFPNTFTFSPPAESVWLAWFAANKNYDGYLRWAYNCWPVNALMDSRFGTWSAGDAFLVYPGNRSSIRFERLIEGIQDFEKIQILKEKFIRENRADKLAHLAKILRVFELSTLKTMSASEMVDQAKVELNNLVID